MGLLITEEAPSNSGSTGPNTEATRASVRMLENAQVQRFSARGDPPEGTPGQRAAGAENLGTYAFSSMRTLARVASAWSS